MKTVFIDGISFKELHSVEEKSIFPPVGTAMEVKHKLYHVSYVAMKIVTERNGMQRYNDLVIEVVLI